MATAVDVTAAFLGQGMPGWAWALLITLTGLEETTSARDPSANSEDRMGGSHLCVKEVSASLCVVVKNTKEGKSFLSHLKHRREGNKCTFLHGK